MCTCNHFKTSYDPILKRHNLVDSQNESILYCFERMFLHRDLTYLLKTYGILISFPICTSFRSHSSNTVNIDYETYKGQDGI